MVLFSRNFAKFKIVSFKFRVFEILKMLFCSHPSWHAFFNWYNIDGLIGSYSKSPGFGFESPQMRRSCGEYLQYLKYLNPPPTLSPLRGPFCFNFIKVKTFQKEQTVGLCIPNIQLEGSSPYFQRTVHIFRVQSIFSGNSLYFQGIVHIFREQSTFSGKSPYFQETVYIFWEYKKIQGIFMRYELIL